MYSIVSTAIIHGIQSVPISVEADVSDGLPVFEMVGFLASEVQEAKERVRTALKNCGFALPPKHITINFTPANIRKSGSGFDLPVAVAVLTAFGYIRQEMVREYLPMPSASKVPASTTPTEEMIKPVLMIRRQAVLMVSSSPWAWKKDRMKPGTARNSTVPTVMMTPTTRRPVRTVSFIRL